MKSKTIVSTIAVSMVLLGVAMANEGGRPLAPQCGQHCVYHICQLLGIPLTLDQITIRFPPKEQGDSLLDISNALESIGIRSVGLKYSMDELVKASFPLVAHFKICPHKRTDVGHFVVVERASPCSIQVYLGPNSRRVMSPKEFSRLWSGYVLIVHKQKAKYEPLSLDKTAQPRIQFDTLFRDVGDISFEYGEVVFPFPFKNRGDEDLVIENIITSRNFITVENGYKQTLPPGQDSSINIVYPIKKIGRFNDSIFIKTNDPVYPNISLSICGNVLTDKIVYRSINFGSVVKGKEISAQRYIYFDSGFPVDFLLSIPEQNGLDVALRPLSESDIQNALPQAKLITVPNLFNRFVLEISIDTNLLDVGTHQMMIKLVNTNYKKIEIIIPLSVIVIAQ